MSKRKQIGKEADLSTISQQISAYRMTQEPAVFIPLRQLRVIPRLLARQINHVDVKAKMKSITNTGYITGQCLTCVQLTTEEASEYEDFLAVEGQQHPFFSYKVPEPVTDIVKQSMYGGADGNHRISAASMLAEQTCLSWLTPDTELPVVPLSSQTPPALMKAYTIVYTREHAHPHSHTVTHTHTHITQLY